MLTPFCSGVRFICLFNDTPLGLDLCGGDAVVTVARVRSPRATNKNRAEVTNEIASLERVGVDGYLAVAWEEAETSTLYCYVVRISESDYV